MRAVFHWIIGSSYIRHCISGHRLQRQLVYHRQVIRDCFLMKITTEQRHENKWGLKYIKIWNKCVVHVQKPMWQELVYSRNTEMPMELEASK